MAIAFDASAASSVGSGGVTSITWIHTCTGSNLYLIVQAFSVGDFISGITYNGVSMSFVGKIVSGSGANYTYLYVLTNPTIGSNTVQVNYSTPTAYAIGGSVSLTGVKQTGQPEANNTLNSTNGILAMVITTIAAGAWFVGGGTFDAGTVSSFTNGISRVNSSPGSWMVTNGPNSSPGSITVTANGPSSNGGAVFISLAPVAFTSATGNMFLMFH